MRLFNFIIETSQVTNTSSTEVIGATHTFLEEIENLYRIDTGKVVVSMTLRDNEAAGGAAHGGYNVYQTITPTPDGDSLLLSGNLSALPDGTAHAGTDDDSITDVISIGQKHKFEG